MTKGDIVSRMKAMSIGALWRHLASIAVVMASLWAFSGPFVKSYAADALRDMLIEQGLSPEDFKRVQQELKDQGVDINAIRSGTAHANDEIDDMQRRLDVIEANSKQTYDLLKTLIPMMRSEVAQ